MDLIDRNNGGNTRLKQFWKMKLPKFYGTSTLYTDQAIHHHRPYIVQIDKVDSRDANIESKYGKKVGHYKDLAIELSRSWQKPVTWDA